MAALLAYLHAHVALATGPAPPQDVAAQSNRVSGATVGVAVSWDANVDPSVTGLVVEVCPDPCSLDPQAADAHDYSATTTSANISLSSPLAAAYDIGVWSTDGATYSQATSFPLVFTPDDTPPTLPGPVSVGWAPAAQGSDQVTVSWPAATDNQGIDHYVVSASSSDATVPPPTSATIPAGTTQWSPPGSYPDRRTYTFTVTAYDTAAPPNASAPISVTVVSADNTPPSSPQLSLTSGGSGCTSLVVQARATDNPGDLPPQPPFGGLSGLLTVTDGVSGATANPVLSLGGSGGVYSGSMSLDPSLSPGFGEYDPVHVTANFMDAAGTASVSQPTGSTVWRLPDTTAPSIAPAVHGSVDLASSSATLQWLPIFTTGAPITKYTISASPSVPGLPTTVTQPGTVDPSQPYSYVATGLNPDINYTFQITAVDACLRAGPAETRIMRVNDTTPPTTPTLSAVLDAAARAVRLSWPASSDNVQVDDYVVRRNGAIIARLDGTSYTDTGITDASSPTYTVTAVDTDGNQAASAPATVTIPDWTPPSAPTGLNVSQPGAGVATVSWTASRDNVGVTAYDVVRDGALLATVPGSVTSYRDTRFRGGQHQWQVRASDAAGNHSQWVSVTQIVKGPQLVVRSDRLGGAAHGRKLHVYRIGKGRRLVLAVSVTPAMPARLRLRVRSGSATVDVSLRKAGTADKPGRLLGHARVRKGMNTVSLATLRQGSYTLVVTASHTLRIYGLAAGASREPRLLALFSAP